MDGEWPQYNVVVHADGYERDGLHGSTTNVDTNTNEGNSAAVDQANNDGETHNDQTMGTSPANQRLYREQIKELEGYNRWSINISYCSNICTNPNF